ncbi:serine protease FAM111B-like [Carcharodon carcharias]|uniref:serine protease FAM111B-like n=1 Tax=Carcharodon carcharias TaxID=13397 RepID=UPI001B7DE3F6|nr:serine protease FAM111B-like [Carcharodon carcharias]
MTEREFTFAFQGSEGERQTAKGGPEQSLISALRDSSSVFSEEERKNEGKAVQLLEGEHLRGALNLGMPCKCLPENAHLEALFVGGGGGSQGREGIAEGKECTTFTVGAAPGKRPILKGPEAGVDLCVFALEGETVGEALSEDGRFLPEVGGEGWRLVERQQGRRAFPLSLAARELQAGAYELGFEGEGAGGRPNLRELAQELDEYLKGRLGGGGPWEAAQKEFEELMGGVTPNRVPSHVAKLPTAMNESVGTLRWSRLGAEGSAACFHLARGHVLTCYHAVKMMVGEGVPESEWGPAVRQAASVSFTYRTTAETQWKVASDGLKAYSAELDYAILALEAAAGQGSELRPGLAAWSTKPVGQGVVYAVGRHFADALMLVPLGPRESGDLSGRRSFQAFSSHSFSRQPRSERAPYGTEFLHDPASSGSPVFSYYGGLVGMSAGGYQYEERVVEFGPTVQAIAAHVHLNHHPLYQLLFGGGPSKKGCSVM